MKTKIIELIKNYRAESEKRWSPVYGYKDKLARRESRICERHADDLEKLLVAHQKADNPDQCTCVDELGQCSHCQEMRHGV